MKCYVLMFCFILIYFIVSYHGLIIIVRSTSLSLLRLRSETKCQAGRRQIRVRVSLEVHRWFVHTGHVFNASCTTQLSDVDRRRASTVERCGLQLYLRHRHWHWTLASQLTSAPCFACFESNRLFRSSLALGISCSKFRGQASATGPGVCDTTATHVSMLNGVEEC